MTCDFKLTDANSGAVVSLDAHKLVTVTRFSFQAIIGFTGLANFRGVPVGRWIAQKASNLSGDASLDGLCDAIREAEVELARVPRRQAKFRHISFVVGAIQGTQSVVALISNFESFQGWFIPRDSEPGGSLRISLCRPRNPRLVVAGDINAVRGEERKLLERSLRSGVSHELVQQRLAALNAKASKRVSTVSEGCYAASLSATGHGVTTPFLIEQRGGFQPPTELSELMKTMGVQIRPAQAAGGGESEPRLIGTMSVSQRGDRKWFEEQFKIRPDDSELWNNFGAFEDSEGRHEESRTAYETALKLDPKNYVAARNLGTLLWFHFKDGTEGRRWVTKSLEHPEDNHRRESLSWLAQAELQCEKDVQAAERYFEESMIGDPISTVETRYAYFLLSFRPERSNVTLETFERVVRRDPNYSEAVNGLALARWLLLSDPVGAQAIVDDFLERFPKDVRTLWAAVDLNIAADDLETAKRILLRLRRTGALNPSQLAPVEVNIALCTGGALAEADAALADQADTSLSGVVRAAIKFCLGDVAGGQALLEEIDPCSLPASLRVEYEAIRCVLLGLPPSQVQTELDQRLPNAFYKLVDDSLFRALARHPQVNDEARTILDEVARAARER